MNENRTVTKQMIRFKASLSLHRWPKIHPKPSERQFLSSLMGEDFSCLEDVFSLETSTAQNDELRLLATFTFPSRMFIQFQYFFQLAQKTTQDRIRIHQRRGIIEFNANKRDLKNHSHKTNLLGSEESWSDFWYQMRIDIPFRMSIDALVFAYIKHYRMVSKYLSSLHGVIVWIGKWRWA